MQPKVFLRIGHALLLSTFVLSLFCMFATVSSATMGFLATCINDERLAYESFPICGGVMLSIIHETKQQEGSNRVEENIRKKKQHTNGRLLEEWRLQFNAATHLWISCGNPWLSSRSRVSSLPLPLVLPVAVVSFPQGHPIASCPLPSQRSSIGWRWHRDERSILGEVPVRRE